MKNFLNLSYFNLSKSSEEFYLSFKINGEIKMKKILNKVQKIYFNYLYSSSRTS